MSTTPCDLPSPADAQAHDEPAELTELSAWRIENLTKRLVQLEREYNLLLAKYRGLHEQKTCVECQQALFDVHIGRSCFS